MMRPAVVSAAVSHRHENPTPEATGSRSSRRGAVLVLVALSLIILMGMLAFTVDVPYMQLVRTELYIATDAAAKAGAEALKRTKDPALAMQAAINIAAQNKVAGNSLILTTNDVVLGRCARQLDGSVSFVQGSTPYNAVRVTAKLDNTTQNGSAKLLFGSLVGINSFSPTQQATAGQNISEICLVLDRSHSMCFDLTGVMWSYPNGLGQSYNYGLAPHPTKSRWAALNGAVNTFTTVVSQQPTPPKVGLVTWGSTMTTSPPFPSTTIDSALTTTMSNITGPISTRGTKTMWGATNMAAGIDAGTALLTSPSANPLADKVMILMTDGQWNEGRDPTLAAQDARNAGVVIHTVCLLAGSSEAVCQQVAAITGGTYTYAGNAAELNAAFEKLAKQMQVTLIQ